MKKLISLYLILIIVTGCKKDSEQTDLSLKKLKSISTTTSYPTSQKITFSYDQSGNLEQAKKYVDGVLKSYLEYKYDVGGLINVKSYLKGSSSATFDLIANIKFAYTSNKLTELSIVPVNPNNSLQPTRYIFEYSSGEIPNKFSLSLADGSIANAGYSYILTTPFSSVQFVNNPGSPRGWIITLPYYAQPYDLTLVTSDFRYQFDDKHNPFYKLPWIDMEYVLNNELAYVFDATGYFGLNNKVETAVYLNNSLSYVYNDNYEYLPNGQPSKRVCLQSPTNFKSETTYEYW